jgi:methylated-DNA-[protein]-cysteine S-methyltransferase
VGRATTLGTALYGSMDSPLGELWVAVSDEGVVKVSYCVDELRFCHELESAGYSAEYASEAIDRPARQLHAYFAGQRDTFDLALDLRALPPFARAVLQAVAAIPRGQVRSYRQIAEAVGKPRAARAIGTAVGSNPLSFLIPCHRVVRSDGTIGEYGVQFWGRSRGIEVKRRLLHAEGVDL